MNPETILVIDDDALTRHMLRRLLQAHGYLVCTASTEGECMACLAEGEPALVLLDVHLPRLHSAQIAAHLLGLPNPPQIVFMSSDDERGPWALELGAAGFLPKPLSFTDLLHTVRQLRNLHSDAAP